ncbi:hypothetical protein GQ600_23513 [Phytophthora cactorum]|nr:hypothetical protein GQ600_23513 [Phytophthora cactorum]
MPESYIATQGYLYPYRRETMVYSTRLVVKIPADRLQSSSCTHHEWMLSKHGHMRYLIVATPPQERLQAVLLTDTINRLFTGDSNAVLIYSKCDSDFDPQSTRVLEGIDSDKRTIPAFALQPRENDVEGLNYSTSYQDVNKWC